MAKCILLVFLLLDLIGTVPANAQSVQCDKKCVTTIRVLLKEQKQRIGTSWYQRANRKLGDSVSVGIQKMFTKKSILSSENIRLFLPVIREAFKDRGMIIEPENKRPTVTLELLNYLKGKVTNPSLRDEIIDTINEIVSLTGPHLTTPRGASCGTGGMDARVIANNLKSQLAGDGSVGHAADDSG